MKKNRKRYFGRLKKWSNEKEKEEEDNVESSDSSQRGGNVFGLEPPQVRWANRMAEIWHRENMLNQGGGGFLQDTLSGVNGTCFQDTLRPLIIIIEQEDSVDDKENICFGKLFIFQKSLQDQHHARQFDKETSKSSHTLHGW